MKEIRDIIRAYDEAVAAGKQIALATVVHLEGSSYRRPGARMLITEEGEMTGAISGGCLEGDALLKAQHVMARNQARVITYDTTDDDSALAIGLGCNGIVRILIEPIDPSDPFNQVSYLKKITADRKRSVLVTLFSLDSRHANQKGTCLLMHENGDYESSYSGLLEESIIPAAKIALEEGKSSFKKYVSSQGTEIAFVELINPAVSLIIFGAGNDVVPLVNMAELLGWTTTVIDGRASYAREERFVSGCQVVVSKPESAFEHIHVDERTVFALMTHNYQYDKAILKILSTRSPVYVGMLGPSKKLGKMLEEFSEEGSVISESFLETVHSPVGLDIGAETPEEIALSILSEIQSRTTGRTGGSLRQRNNEIHPREDTRIEERKLE
ncbi:XdhC/CoxI family protein [Pollutibacter soli]|uniref:XdhC family protein n=1 Tax=Pollutibacter soli TaxID=3034157 RepID=UPI0030136B48